MQSRSSYSIIIIVAIIEGALLWFNHFGNNSSRDFCGIVGVLQDESSGKLYNRGNDTKSESRVHGNINTHSKNIFPRKPKMKKKTYDKARNEPTLDPNVFEGVFARAFDIWPRNLSIPCFDEPEETQQAETDTGLLFLKPYKTGSSTASGINLRIARNVAQRQTKNFTLCKSRFDHTRASCLFPHRDPKKSFLWTIVRDPTKRVISQFFHFKVSRHKNEPSDEVFLNYLRKGKMIRDYYIGALSTQKYKRGDDNAVDFANQILKDYNFVGITARMDESAVALAMLLSVPIADVLYLKAKGHGGYDAGGRRDHISCTYIWPSFVSKGMEEYFKSDEWLDIVHWDRVFYQAANRSLDLTIDKLGRERFEQNLAKYRIAKEVAHDRCLPRTRFPCSAGGKYSPAEKTDCLWKDSGCGSECLDEIAEEFDLW